MTDCQAPIACLDSLDRVTPDHIAETRNANFFRPCFPSKCGTFYTLTSINVVLGVVRMLHAIFRHTTALQQSYLHVRLLDLKKNAPCLSIFYTYSAYCMLPLLLVCCVCLCRRVWSAVLLCCVLCERKRRVSTEMSRRYLPRGEGIFCLDAKRLDRQP